MFELAADGLRFELWGKETRSWPGPGADGSDRSSFSTGERWIYRHLILEPAGRHDGTGEGKTDRRLPPLTLPERFRRRSRARREPESRRATEPASRTHRAREGAHRRDEMSVRYDGTARIGSSAVGGPSLSGRCGIATSSSGPSFSSDGAPGDSRPYACNMRNG